MNRSSEIEAIIQKAFWDYDIDPEWVISVLEGSIPGKGFFTRDRLFLRLIERLPWYDLVRILGIEYIKNNLSPAIIFLIRNKTLRERYELIRKILYGEIISPSGWSAENRERLQRGVLFKRWHSS